MNTFIQWLPIIGSLLFLSTIGYVAYSATHHNSGKKKKSNRRVTHSA